ncbi:hypothetical protein KIN20_037032 [Parelaphostrongylus tenuis]|uniref:Uncharacterized protein n=1 Tax=Parelaphostrongylus tenuis TaxID=148309 RepID=A0AAD5WLP3_PARTN|nr:hypothetical protein KIN20_037032 [Parelaphostrongylus tenuis]
MPQDRKIDMLLSVLEMDRFIVLLNEKENLAELLKGYAEEQRDYVERALEFAYHSQRAKTVTELGKCGLFIGLGDLNRLNGKIQQAIQEVQQIFPHFSIQYAHTNRVPSTLFWSDGDSMSPDNDRACNELLLNDIITLTLPTTFMKES